MLEEEATQVWRNDPGAREGISHWRIFRVYRVSPLVVRGYISVSTAVGGVQAVRANFSPRVLSFFSYCLDPSMALHCSLCRAWNGQVGGLYAGEEVTAVGQQGAWLHVRLYEFDEDEEEDKEDDQDVRVHLPPSATSTCRYRVAKSSHYSLVKVCRFCG